MTDRDRKNTKTTRRRFLKTAGAGSVGSAALLAGVNQSASAQDTDPIVIGAPLPMTGGVAADGSAWLGLNYGRLARLRLVPGYPGALDWSKEEPAPENDGMFIVDIETGKPRLLVSYRQLEDLVKEEKPDLKHTGLFINHTLWNRDCNRIYFIVRAG